MKFYLNGSDADWLVVNRMFNEHLYKLAGVSSSDIVLEDYLINEPLTFHDSFGADSNDFNLNAFVERRQKGLDSFIVFNYAYEAGTGLEEIDSYTKKLKSCDVDPNRVTFLFNKSAQVMLSQKDFFNGYENIHYLDYFSILSYYRILNRTNKVTTKPVYDRKPVLNILLGKLLSKKSRLQALNILYGMGLAQEAVKGILISREHLLEHEKEFESKQFFRWVLKNLGPADKVELMLDTVDNKTLISNSSPYDVAIYNNSQVSYVCETACPEVHQPHTFITEKTYNPIFNRSPFVLQGAQDSLPYLKSLGYDVFDKYVGEYYKEHDYKKYIKATTAAARDLLLAINKYPKEIDKIAENNCILLNDSAKKGYSLLRNIIGV